VKRTFLLSAFILAIFLAFAPDRARADEITVAGSTASTPPVGITFTADSFSGTTAGGFAAFSNLGSYKLSSNPGVYSGDVVDVVVTFTVPSGISGGGASTFVANQCQRERLIFLHRKHSLCEPGGLDKSVGLCGRRIDYCSS
jgi:hypothetical protein